MTLEEVLNICISEELIDLIISGPKNKSENSIVKIKVRPLKLKNELYFQASEYKGKQVLHSNYIKNDVILKITDWIINDYKQLQITTTKATAQILSGKKGNLTIKYKNSNTCYEKRDFSHNRTKQYIIEEGKPVSFLIDLGVMTKEGKIITQRYDKFRQINRFLEFIEDIIPQLDKNREQTIIDFGCGKSYLTFAMYYYLNEIKGYNVKIIGLDLKKDVIEKCNELKDAYGYEKLRFLVGDIASYDEVDSVDMVVTLHACDTATDYAIAKAVKWGAKVILSVPCCQHEANKTIKNDMLSPVMKYGILKERMSAIITDAARAQMLESKGYSTQILEFIDMEHTPKNLLIRAVRTQSYDSLASKRVSYMEEQLGVKLTIDRLLNSKDYNGI